MLHSSPKSIALLFTALGYTLPALIPAMAHADDGYYAGAGLGLTKGTDSSTTSGAVKFDTGVTGVFFMGKQLDENWRGEAEIARRSLDLSSVAGATASGDAKATSLMGNAIYDFNAQTSLTPYIGAGIGFAKVEMNNASPFGASSINDSDTVGAFQALAGASYALNAQVDLFTDYRYFTTADAGFTAAAGAASSMNLSTHNVMAGLRFTFGMGGQQAATGARTGMSGVSGDVNTAAASQADARTTQSTVMPTHTLPKIYTVHFVLNKADVTAQDIATIEEAASNAKAMDVTRLVLTGHTDRSGDAAYNLALSKKRAEAVKMAFVALGFDEAEITVKAKGETSLLVPTADDKFEPRNRRVEIVLP